MKDKLGSFYWHSTHYVILNNLNVNFFWGLDTWRNTNLRSDCTQHFKIRFWAVINHLLYLTEKMKNTFVTLQVVFLISIEFLNAENVGCRLYILFYVSFQLSNNILFAEFLVFWKTEFLNLKHKMSWNFPSQQLFL